MKILFHQNIGNADTPNSLTAGLGKDHEILRRRIENGAKELWFFLQSELKKLKNLEGNELQRHVDEFLSDLGHHERYTFYFTFHLGFSKNYNLRMGSWNFW